MKKPALFFLLAAASLYAALNWTSLRLLFHVNSDEPVVLFEYINLNKKATGPLSYDGKGLALDEHARINVLAAPDGWFSLSLPPMEKAYTVLHIDAWLDGDGRQELAIKNMATGRTRVLSRSRRLAQYAREITDMIEPGQPHQIFLRVHSDGPEPARSVIVSCAVKRVPTAPYFPRLPAFLIGLLAVYLAIESMRHGLAWGALLTVVLLLAVNASSAIVSSPWIEWSALLLVVCDRARRARAGVHEALWVVVAAGFIVRWKLLAGTLGLSLGGGDATVYQNLAMQFTWAHPYDTYFREPAFIWMQHSAAALFGPNELSFRLSSMTASLMSVVLIYFLACALSDRVTAIFAAGLMALGDFVVTLSVRGDRNDTYTFFMLLFCLCLITFKNRHWRSEALLGLIGAVLSLVWLVGLPAVGFLYLCRWFRNKISAAHAVYFFIVLGAFLIPHFVYQYRHFGDPFFALNHPANALEGIAKTGVPSDWSGGSTWAHVIGSGMGIIGFVRRFFMGYVDLFLNPTNLYNKSFLGFHYSLAYSYLLYPFLIVGYVVEIRRRNFLPFLLLFGFLNVMVIFLQEAIIPRWFLHAAPFVAYFWAAGAAAVFRAIKVKSSLDGKP
jgi:hypothetical protein